jgi:hypothetical protein
MCERKSINQLEKQYCEKKDQLNNIYKEQINVMSILKSCKSETSEDILKFINNIPLYNQCSKSIDKSYELISQYRVVLEEVVEITMMGANSKSTLDESAEL